MRVGIGVWCDWLRVMAKLQQIDLPVIDDYGMGSNISKSVKKRFFTVKRRFVPEEQAKIDGIRWGLWTVPSEDRNFLACTFLTPIEPSPQLILNVYCVITGWLFDQWDLNELERNVKLLGLKK